MIDGEYKEIIAEMKGVKEILIDFRGYSRRKFDNIDNHLGELNSKVATHETEITKKCDKDEILGIKVAIEKNKVNKVFWGLFTGSVSLVSVLITYLLTNGG